MVFNMLATTFRMLRLTHVRQARELETKFFTDMGVYIRIPRVDQVRCKGKSIKTRWIVINKGVSIALNYKSGFVGQECETYAVDSLYASIPPRGASIDCE